MKTGGLVYEVGPRGLELPTGHFYQYFGSSQGALALDPPSVRDNDHIVDPWVHNPVVPVERVV
jgi:hypothetical protein